MRPLRRLRLMVGPVSWNIGLLPTQAVTVTQPDEDERIRSVYYTHRQQKIIKIIDLIKVECLFDWCLFIVVFAFCFESKTRDAVRDTCHVQKKNVLYFPLQILQKTVIRGSGEREEGYGVHEGLSIKEIEFLLKKSFGPMESWILCPRAGISWSVSDSTTFHLSNEVVRQPPRDRYCIASFDFSVYWMVNNSMIIIYWCII